MSTALIIPLEGLLEADVRRLQKSLAMARRNAAIRAKYPSLRDAVGQLQALASLAETYRLSETQVRRILYAK